jgi:hypothetical protein
VEKRPKVRVEVPDGLGLSDEQFIPLIEDWIAPRLVQLFVDQETNPELAMSCEKKPVRSDAEFPSAHCVPKDGIRNSRLA